jgi:hypothetical protein
MNGMREAFYNLRYRWPGERVGGPGAAMRGQWAILSLLMLVVFGGFFAVGRLMHTHTGSATVAAAPSTQAGPGPRAIPVRLSGGSPIAGGVPAAIALRPRPRPIARRATEERPRSATTAGSSGPETAGGEATSESQTATAPAPEPAPEPAPAPSKAPAQRSGGSGQNGSAGGGSRPSGGVTFDSSQ